MAFKRGIGDMRKKKLKFPVPEAKEIWEDTEALLHFAQIHRGLRSEL